MAPTPGASGMAEGLLISSLACDQKVEMGSPPVGGAAFIPGVNAGSKSPRFGKWRIVEHTGGR